MDLDSTLRQEQKLPQKQALTMQNMARKYKGCEQNLSLSVNGNILVEVYETKTLPLTDRDKAT